MHEEASRPSLAATGEFYKTAPCIIPVINHEPTRHLCFHRHKAPLNRAFVWAANCCPRDRFTRLARGNFATILRERLCCRARAACTPSSISASARVAANRPSSMHRLMREKRRMCAVLLLQPPRIGEKSTFKWRRVRRLDKQFFDTACR